MSTHNIGFYEDLTKIVFELSSNMHLISSAVSSPIVSWAMACQRPCPVLFPSQTLVMYPLTGG